MSSRRLTRRKVSIEPRAVPPERPGADGGVRDARRRERTAALATAALRLFLDEGIEAVTIDDIARRAGLAKGTFYTYFRDKADLVEGLFAPVSARVLSAFDRCEEALREARDDASLTAAYQTLALETAAALLEHQGVVLLYLQECRGPAKGARKPVALLAREVQARGVRLTDTARERRLLRPLDPRVTATAVVGAVEGLLFQVLSGAELGDPVEVSATLIDLILHGVGQSALS